MPSRSNIKTMTPITTHHTGGSTMKPNSMKNKVASKPKTKSNRRQRGGSTMKQNSMKNKVGSKSKSNRSHRRHRGGSPASEMVMNQLTNGSKTEMFPACDKMTGDMSSLNTYQTTGGSRKSNRKNKSMKGGGSDWMTTQYSLGSYNAPEASVGQFSASAAASRSDYMNPPTLGLAGSGSPMTALEGGNVHTIGAPLV